MALKHVKPIFLLSCLVALAYQLLISYVIVPAFTRDFIATTEDEAQLVAHHITMMLMGKRATLPQPGEIAPDFVALPHEFHLEKLKLHDAQGTIVYSSEPDEIGIRHESTMFRTAIAQGQPYTALLRKGDKTLSGRVVPRDVVEAFVPILRDGHFIGAVDVHYDVSERWKRHSQTLAMATTLPLALIFLFLLAVMASLFVVDHWQKEPAVSQTMAQSPQFSLFFTLISLFVVALLVSFFLHRWEVGPPFLKALVGALLLPLLVTPLLYFFINRPLLQHIAERRKTEAALHDSQERFRDLFENASDLIQSIAPDGHFLYVNPAWRKIMGYSEEEVKRLNIFDILAPEETAHCQAAFGEVMAGKPVDRIETAFIAKDGRRISLEGNTSVKLVEGRPMYTRAIFHDISARKEAEIEMERLIAELQKSLAEVKTLSGLLPICSWCKKIRDDKGYWNQLESYISQHSGVDFSHGVCPDCMRKHYPELMNDEKKIKA